MTSKYNNNKLYALIIVAICYINFNEYFGWNRRPGSDAEMICDMLMIIIVMQFLQIWQRKG